jgi:GT2 family glycosyltransferase
MKMTRHILTDVFGIVATKDRPVALQRTFQSLANQSVHPKAIVVVDASSDSYTRDLCERGIEGLCSEVRWIKAEKQGAAIQRNQGIGFADHPIVLFFDDDVVFEPECLARLWQALHIEVKIGGANAMIVNQNYQPPGTVSRFVFELMNGGAETTFAGKVIGPAINLLPEDSNDMPEVVPVDWLNTTCTMYRREALPNPPFDPFFAGYSLMEDVALSLKVADRGWKLANARTARIVHESQPGEHKSDIAARATMELVNRHYVMTKILHRTGVVDHLKLAVWEAFQLAVCAARTETRGSLWPSLKGKWRGAKQIRANA